MAQFEFLIQEADGELFNLSFDKGEFAAALRITSQTAEVIKSDGMHCLRLAQGDISMNDEMAGIQVIFNGQFSLDSAQFLTAELATHLSEFTRQAAEVIDLNGELQGKVISF